MASGDATNPTWERELGGRVGRAIAGRRTQLLLTAASLAQRTAALGHPLSPATISRIEANERSGRIDLAELLVLAAALEIPPMLLLFPGFPDGSEPVLPGVTASSDAAARWLSGTEAVPGTVDAGTDRGLYATSSVNAGIALVESVNQARDLHLDEFRLRMDLDAEQDAHRAAEVRARLASGAERLQAARGEIEQARAGLWGEAGPPV